MGERRVYRKYTRELLEPLVAESVSVAEVMRRLGLRQNGGAHAHLSRMIRQFELDTSHFVRGRNLRPSSRRRTASEILVRRPSGSRREKPHLLKRAMIEVGIPHRCRQCGNDGTWQGKPLGLDVDHIDGDFLNNQHENLRFLCPNCHRQTPNFAGRSRGRSTVSTKSSAAFRDTA